MKTIKDYTSFVNENVKETVNEFVDVELDADVVDYYLEITENGSLSKEEAIDQVANDFGISDQAVAIIIDAAGITESIEESIEEEEEEEEEIIEESSDEDKYLSAKQKKLPDGLKKGIIAKAKKSAGDKSKKDSKDEKKDDKKSDKKDKDDKDSKDDKEDKGGSDEDKYLSAKQKKLPEGLKKAIIAKAKKKK